MRWIALQIPGVFSFYAGGDGLVLHPGLEDEDGGHAVYDLAAAFDRHFGFAEETVGFGGGEALVPEVDGELGALVQVVGEKAHFFGLGAFGATHAQGQADDDLFDFVLSDEVGEEFEVEALVLAAVGGQALRGDAEEVGDGEANGFRADVEAEEAADLRGGGLGRAAL